MGTKSVETYEHVNTTRWYPPGVMFALQAYLIIDYPRKAKSLPQVIITKLSNFEYLVGGLEQFGLFVHSVGNFRGVGQPPTRYHDYILIYLYSL